MSISSFGTKLVLGMLALVLGARSLAAQASARAPGAFGDAYAEAIGLEPLRFQALPTGSREMRIWVGGGLGWPQDLYRLVAVGGTITGEYVRYWDLDDHHEGPDSTSFDALMRYHERGRCEPVLRGKSAEACRVLFQVEPDWRQIWRAADSLGLWTLPEAPTVDDGTFTEDGWTIIVELRAGASYRVLDYPNPIESRSAEEAQMVAFDKTLRPVWPAMRRPAEEQVWIGRLEARADTLTFYPCAGGGPWLLLLRDRELRDGTLRSTDARQATVRGELVPEWVARDSWKVPVWLTRTVEVDTVRALSSWTPDACGKGKQRAH